MDDVVFQRKALAVMNSVSGCSCPGPAPLLGVTPQGSGNCTLPSSPCKASNITMET